MLHASGPQPPARVVGSHGEVSRALSASAVTLVRGRCRGPYYSGGLDVRGDPALVAGFSRAAAAAGVEVSRRGDTRLQLLAAGATPRPADVAVAVDVPYPLGRAPRASTQIALFGTTPPAWSVLVDVLAGRLRPTGRLPVAVPGAAPPRCPGAAR
jgi:beta-N-acetylhexosaminidase